MSHQYFYNPNSVIESYQICFDYETCLMDNHNYFASSPAFQVLNQPQLSNNLCSVDLTCEPDEPLTPVLSPTQAEDFKLLCEICKRSFRSKKRFQNHTLKCQESIKKGKLFPCHSCCKTFKGQMALKKHKLQHQDETLHHGKEDETAPHARPTRSIFHNVELLAVSDCH
jgi:Zinc-finger of C2H2 type